MPIEEHYSSDPFMRRGSACGGFRNAFDSPFSSSADHRRDPFRHDPWPKPPPQEPPRPWRGIAVETLPSNLKKQLSPHYSDWIVVDPEQARYRRPGAQLQLFAEHKNGWAPIADLSRLDFAQKHYALARRTSTRPRGGAAGGLAAVAPPWARPVVRGTCEPTPGVRIKSPADGAVLPLASQRFSVEGNAYDAQNIRVVWHNLASGHSGQFTQAAAAPSAPPSGAVFLKPTPPAIISSAPAPRRPAAAISTRSGCAWLKRSSPWPRSSTSWAPTPSICSKSRMMRLSRPPRHLSKKPSPR
ncbi:hypothetical protein [Geoalkalibacter halelectricus]|uniref:hypothetical protein n=1 Tax=Geoalkalibacter halelectricus TaxID=2847045 RepID=UPI00266FFB42|nr:hypothetical protein [Geoalkalibacter halelectricus]MDO3378324.1 hypothetical protein [Geoalkalibacter halelectricus]